MSETVPANKRGMGGHRVPVHGNERTMNLNHLILANITESAYFRSDLVQLKSYEDMMDEIYYRVQHLEPWEKVLLITNLMTRINIVSGVAESIHWKYNWCRARNGLLVYSRSVQLCWC